MTAVNLSMDMGKTDTRFVWKIRREKCMLIMHWFLFVIPYM